MRKVLLLSLLLSTLLVIPGHVYAEDLYIGQSSAGGDTGANCANQHAYTFFNSFSNWGAGAGKISAGDTVHICGTLTAATSVNGYLVFQDSGTAGNPITLLWETGAIVQSPAFTVGITVPGGSSYITVDGGTNGILRNTANGTGLANSQDGKMIEADNCTHCDFTRLNITGVYVHNSSSTTDNGQNGSGIWVWGDDINIHDNVCVDSGKCFEVVGNYAGNSSNIRIYNNDVSQAGWGMACAVYSGRVLTNLIVYSNHFHDYDHWDTPGGTGVHKNFIAHCYSTGSPLGKIQNAYFYNNVVDGNLGQASETTSALFLESSDTPWTDSTGTAYIFNNVFGGTFSDGFGPAGGLISVGTGNGHKILSNTFLGVNRTDGDIVNMNPCCGAPAATNVTVEDNVAQSGDHLLYLGTGTTITSIDYNTYANSRDFTRIGATEYTTFAAWQSVCLCDAHSTFAQASPLSNLSGAGVPSTGFAGTSAGLNLTSSATGLLSALALDTSAGNSRTPVSRPGSGSWVTGAYTLGATSNSPPGPPPGLIVRLTSLSNEVKNQIYPEV